MTLLATSIIFFNLHLLFGMFHIACCVSMKGRAIIWGIQTSMKINCRKMRKYGISKIKAISHKEIWLVNRPQRAIWFSISVLAFADILLVPSAFSEKKANESNMHLNHKQKSSASYICINNYLDTCTCCLDNNKSVLYSFISFQNWKWSVIHHKG